MQVEFLSKFSKDIDRINQKSVRSNLSRLIKSFLLELSTERIFTKYSLSFSELVH